MARGSEGKSKRKAARKEARAAEAERLLSEGGHNEFDQPPEDSDDAGGGGSAPPGVPLPPGMAPKERDDDSDDSSDRDEGGDDGDDGDDDDTPKTRKKKGRPGARPPRATTPTKKEGIKTLPLIMLILLTGTTLLPALLFLGDKLGDFVQKKHLLGNLGYRLGVGPSPRKRVMSFYEKHSPEKLDEVPAILSKYYGDYPKLVKRLERKYGDYGYFINWEQDEAPMTLAFDQLHVTKDKIVEKWDQYAPELAKTGARNMKHNFNFLHKKARSIWRKKIWPVLQPYLGVPDAKAAREQKRKDARAAQERKGGRRKMNTEYRDDIEDEM